MDVRTSRLSPVRWLGLVAAVVLTLIVPLGSSSAVAATPRVGFGFSAGDVSGFPTGSVSLTGGGAFDLDTSTIHAGGGFSCTHEVDQLFLAGCLQGQGVRWDTDTVLPSTLFKCTGSVGEAAKTATSGSDTVVMQADFYRAGDANDESFTAQMIVSTRDIAGDIQGIQNVWVQGVGCGAATVHFGR